MARKKSVSKAVTYPSAAVHHIVLFQLDKDGKLQWKEEDIKAILKRHDGAFNSFAYILHDKDRYNAEAVYENQELNEKTYIERYRILADAKSLEKDETQITGYLYDEALDKAAHEYADEQFPEIKENEPKPAHYHVVITFSQNRNVSDIARWFKIEPNWVAAKKGRGAATSAMDYLVHRHDQSKYQYEPEEVRASFDYIHELEARIAKEVAQERYHISIDDINDYVEKVHNGMSLNSLIEEISYPVYARNRRLFEKAREDYINQVMPMPPNRFVFYVEAIKAKGGEGKSLLTHALAKQLALEFGADITQDYNSVYLRQYIFDSGDTEVAIQKYDAQPILVINEMTAADMITTFGGRRGVKEMLEPFPTKQSKHVKFGDTSIMAKYIIINGIESAEDFIQRLAGEYIDNRGNHHHAEDSAMRQFYRRIWTIFRIINEDYFDILFNKGIWCDTSEYQAYITVKNVRGNFKKVIKRFDGAALTDIEGRMLRPFTEKKKEYDEAHPLTAKISDPDMIDEEFLLYGEVVEEEDQIDPNQITMVEAIEEAPTLSPKPADCPVDLKKAKNCLGCKYRGDCDMELPF